MKYLVSQGADIHAQGDWALKVASRIGHLDMVKYLLSQGADIDKIENKTIKSLFKEITELKNQVQELATSFIQKGCHNWLYKPECKDGTYGIVPRIGMKNLNIV